MDDAGSHSDSDGVYWPESESQDEWWKEAVELGDGIAPGEIPTGDGTLIFSLHSSLYGCVVTLGRAPGVGLMAGAFDGQDDEREHNRAKRTKMSLDSDEESEVLSLIADGGDKAAISGSVSLWCAMFVELS